jgi:hypothetical protein
VDTLPYDHAVWRYRMDEPAPVPALAVASGAYRIRSLTPSRCGDGCPVVEAWSLDDSAAFSGAWVMVDFFTRRVGRYPYPRLIHAEAAVPAAFAAPGLVLHPQGSLSGNGPADSVLALATARQWFGLAVSPAGPEDQVLVEALARVLAEAWLARPGQLSYLVPGDSLTTADPAVTELRRLRQRAGDTAFFAGLRAFAEVHIHRSASRADFARAMSAATGREVEREMPFIFDRAR